MRPSPSARMSPRSVETMLIASPVAAAAVVAVASAVVAVASAVVAVASAVVVLATSEAQALSRASTSNDGIAIRFIFLLLNRVRCPGRSRKHYERALLIGSLGSVRLTNWRYL